MGKSDGRSNSRTAVCEICGTTFAPKYMSAGRFCSHDCLNRRGRRTVTYACEQCGKVVTRKDSGREWKFCSSSCSVQYQWATATPEERDRQVAAAHDAVRGTKRAMDERLALAGSRERLRTGIGPHEVTFAAMLDEAGIGYNQQTAWRTYNLDFSLTEAPVAVEIVGRYSTGRRGPVDEQQRREDVLDGWHLFEVIFRKDFRALGPRVIDELVAFVEETGEHPPAPGQHRMVRADGRRVGSSRHRFDRAEIARLAAERLNHQEIAEILGCSSRTVWLAQKELGISPGVGRARRRKRDRDAA